MSGGHFAPPTFHLQPLLQEFLQYNNISYIYLLLRKSLQNQKTLLSGKWNQWPFKGFERCFFFFFPVFSWGQSCEESQHAVVESWFGRFHTQSVQSACHSGSRWHVCKNPTTLTSPTLKITIDRHNETHNSWRTHLHPKCGNQLRSDAWMNK